MVRDIWQLQLRLLKPRGKRALQLLEHPRFRAAYDFLLLREQLGEQLNDMGNWWTRIQESNPQLQQEMVRALSPQGKRHRSRKPVRKKPSGD